MLRMVKQTVDVRSESMHDSMKRVMSGASEKGMIFEKFGVLELVKFYEQN